MTQQLTFRLTAEQTKKTWAFAITRPPTNRLRRPRHSPRYRQAVITACSKEARALGIRAGMKYEEAKAMLPDMKILVIEANRG